MIFPIAYEARLTENGSKHMALYLALRDAIVNGRLPPDERLPSTRGLASLYGLSRGSVSLAYEMLAAEGFVRAGVGQGTFVTGSPEADQRLRNSKDEKSAPPEPALSAWGRRMMELSVFGAVIEEDRPGAPIRVSFVPQHIGIRRFPWPEWRSVISACMKKQESGEAAVASSAGNQELRQAVAGRLRRERGILCREEDVVVTGGSMQAIALLCQILLESGKTAIAENPCYSGIRQAILATGAELRHGEVDANGIVPENWDAEVLLVTPARQFPTGAVQSYERRLALLEWASNRGAWIVEDDFDSDFRWGGKPIEPLKALDREGRVVYVGTFSRSVRSDVRIGFAVVPPALREPIITAKTFYEPYTTGATEQQALAEWMKSGGFDRHMRRMRRVYGRLEGTLRSEFEGMLGKLFRVFPSDAGLHLYAQWSLDAVQYDQLREACLGLGVEWKDARVYDAQGGNRPPSSVFSFAHLEEEEIREGMARIRGAAQRLRLV